MAIIYTIEDNTGEKIAEMIAVHDIYLLPDGSQMVVGTTIAWCNKCRSFVNVEQFWPPENFERAAQRIYGKGKPLVPVDQLTPHARERWDHFNKAMKSAAVWREVLANRKSPPRCLDCGATTFVLLPQAGEWIDHPAIPGRRVRIRSGHCHVSMARSGRLYDKEGNKITDADLMPG